MSAFDASGQLFRHGLFPLRLQVTVDIGRRSDVGMSHPFLNFFQTVSVIDEKTGAAMPLRYIYDNTRKSSNCNGSAAFLPSFQRQKNRENQSPKTEMFH